MKKLLIFVGAVATSSVAFLAFAAPAAVAQPANKLLAVANCGTAGTFSTFIANTNAFVGEKVGATAVNLAGPGAGVAFGLGGVTFRGVKPYGERGVADRLTSCDITVYMPTGAVTFPGVQVLLAGVGG